MSWPRAVLIPLGINLAWSGEGVDEVGVNCATGEVIIRIDPGYFRPTEVDVLRGDASKARDALGWEPKIQLLDLIKEMVAEDLKVVAQEAVSPDVEGSQKPRLVSFR
jgi:GDPmannose 4,6-dehydratase